MSATVRRNVLDDAKHDAMDKVALDRARAAADYADSSPLCGLEELTQDVYVD